MAIKVTDNAKNQINSLMRDSQFKNPVIRINVNGFGWNGPRMDLVLDELSDNDQNIIKNNDVNVVYDLKLKNYIDSVIIDYQQDIPKEGFFILNGRSCC